MSFSASSAFSAVRGIMRAFQYAFSSRKYWKTPGKSPVFGFKGKDAITSLARSYDTKMTTFSAQNTQKPIKMHSQRPSEPFFRAAWLPPIRAFFTPSRFHPILLPSSPLCAISVPKKGPKRPEFSPPSYFFTDTTHPAPRSPRPLRLFLHPCPSAFICGSSANHIAVRSTFSASSFALFASLREAILAALSAPSPRPLRLFLHPCPSALICGSSSDHIAVRSTFSPSSSALFASLREAILAALSAPSPLSAVPLPSFPNQVGILSCSNHPKIPTFWVVPSFFGSFRVCVGEK